MIKNPKISIVLITSSSIEGIAALGLGADGFMYGWEIKTNQWVELGDSKETGVPKPEKPKR